MLYSSPQPGNVNAPDSAQLLPLPSKPQHAVETEFMQKQKLSPESRKHIQPLWRHLALCTALLVTLIGPLIVLIVWYCRVFQPQHLQFWRSAPIGGKFEQIAAKTVDILCSAILAPLVMTLVCRVWFRYARTITSNGVLDGGRGVQVVSLLELSITSSGTYDPWRLWSLLRASRLRFYLVAVLAFLSAVSTSLFVNVIAYEAFPTEQSFVPGKKASLMLLPAFEIGLSMPQRWDAGVRNWAGADSKVVMEATSALHQISYGTLQVGSGQSWSSTSGNYIAINASKNSLDAVHPDVMDLLEIPATRLGIRCLPANMTRLSISEFKEQADLSLISTELNPKSSTFMAYLIGSNAQITEGKQGMPVYAILWDILAPASGTGFILATFVVNNESRADTATAVRPIPFPVIESDFGDLQPYHLAYNTVAGNANERSNKTISWYGLRCNMTRSVGSANLTRSTTRVQDWTISSSRFNQSSADTPSLLHPLYKGLFPYQAPSGSVSGFGTAFGAYAQLGRGMKGAPNMTAYAHAFVQASGAIETSLLNSAVSNNTIVPQPESLSVAGVEMVLKYRMTYVPGILVLGLVTLSVCAGIVLGMTASSWGQVTTKPSRFLDGLRFVVDFAETLRSDETLVEASTWGRERLEKWARDVKLRYILSEMDDENEGGVQHMKLVKKQ